MPPYFAELIGIGAAAASLYAAYAKTILPLRVVAMVATDGRVEFAHPVAGPPGLVPAALESVRDRYGWTVAEPV